MYADPYGLETIIVSNLNGGYLFGYGGSHTGLVVLRDGPESSNSFIYDSSGSYRIVDITAGTDANGNPQRVPLGSGRLIEGNEWTPIDLQDYIDFQIREDGKAVEIFRFDTTREQEAQILERVELFGGGSGFSCTRDISEAIMGIGPFKNVTSSLFPTDLAKELREIQKNTE